MLSGVRVTADRSGFVCTLPPPCGIALLVRVGAAFSCSSGLFTPVATLAPTTAPKVLCAAEANTASHHGGGGSLSAASRSTSRHGGGEPLLPASSSAAACWAASRFSAARRRRRAHAVRARTSSTRTISNEPSALAYATKSAAKRHAQLMTTTNASAAQNPSNESLSFPVRNARVNESSCDSDATMTEPSSAQNFHASRARLRCGRTAIATAAKPASSAIESAAARKCAATERVSPAACVPPKTPTTTLIAEFTALWSRANQ